MYINWFKETSLNHPIDLVFVAYSRKPLEPVDNQLAFPTQGTPRFPHPLMWVTQLCDYKHPNFAWYLIVNLQGYSLEMQCRDPCTLPLASLSATKSRTEPFWKQYKLPYQRLYIETSSIQFVLFYRLEIHLILLPNRLLERPPKRRDKAENPGRLFLL